MGNGGQSRGQGAEQRRGEERKEEEREAPSGRVFYLISCVNSPFSFLPLLLIFLVDRTLGDCMDGIFTDFLLLTFYVLTYLRTYHPQLSSSFPAGCLF
jgi:hypothetical protein